MRPAMLLAAVGFSGALVGVPAAAAISGEAEAAAGLAAEGLALDAECRASPSGDCALSALQFRVTKVTAEPWQQCGGAGWMGPTDCPDNFKCAGKDQWYSQCIPEDEELPEPQVQNMQSNEPERTMEPLPPRPPMPEPPKVEKLNPVVIKGNYLYDSVTGKRFFAKGTSYNPRRAKFNENGRSKGSTCVAGDAAEVSYTADIIADEHEQFWTADLKVIANLGANTVRLFNIDASKNHTKFMNTAEALGLYVIIPLNSKDYGFLPAFPSPSCYTTNMTHLVMGADGKMRPYGNVGTNVLSYGRMIVEQFSKFDNTLFFTVNNEFAMNDKDGFAGFQCVKALTRDIHEYQKSCSASMRRVPLIYSDYDMGPPDRSIVANYLSCALESEDDAIDAYGLNVYSYCAEKYPGNGKADNFQYSPYGQIKEDFKDFGIPVLFTEFGCVEGDFLNFCPYEGGRTWPDVELFFSDAMGEIMSGAIAYTYEQDYEERGMVLTPGFLANQTDIYPLDNYYALQKEFSKNTVSTAWDADGSITAKCNWTPDEVAPQQRTHNRPTCPSKSVGLAVQKRRRTSDLTDWHTLPPRPATDAATCPNDDVSKAIKAEGKCHWNRSD